METEARVEFRYQPKYCAFLRTKVWAIVTKRADGSWKIVNCLDKEDACFHLGCAFTSDGGEWPYKTSRSEQPQDVSERFVSG